jgi:hypothetical protein
MDSKVRGSAALCRRGILRRVANKPFSTNYRIPTLQGYIVINGEQITKIDAIRQYDALGLPVSPEAWTVIFYLSDGNKHEIRPSEWTSNFVQDVFKSEL